MGRIGLSKAECEIALQSYLEEIQELMGLVEDHKNMTVPMQDKASRQLSDLKSCLKTDFELRRTAKSEAQMTDVERAIFSPAVSQTYAFFGIKAGSKPSPEWFSQLYEAEGTISYALESLKGWVE